MFVLDQRASTSNINLLALRRLFVDGNDKIRINKSNVYYEDRINLKN